MSDLFKCGVLFGMVEIVHHPCKELVIGECTQYPTVEFLCGTLAAAIGGGRPIALNWANGVAFSFGRPPPTTEWLIKERLKGRIYWSSVVYALMPDYKPRMKVGKLDVRIIKTVNPLLQQVANWLKGRAGKAV